VRYARNIRVMHMEGAPMATTGTGSGIVATEVVDVGQDTTILLGRMTAR
jgi:hypothetical protein